MQFESASSRGLPLPPAHTIFTTPMPTGLAGQGSMRSSAPDIPLSDSPRIPCRRRPAPVRGVGVPAPATTWTPGVHQPDAHVRAGRLYGGPMEVALAPVLHDTTRVGTDVPFPVVPRNGRGAGPSPPTRRTAPAARALPRRSSGSFPGLATVTPGEARDGHQLLRPARRQLARRGERRAGGRGPSILCGREGRAARRHGARAARRVDRARRRAGDRAEARRAGGARARRRRAARPPAAAPGRRPHPDPDPPRSRRPRRALRAAPLGGAPARGGGAAALPGRQGRDRPADRARLLLRLRLPELARRGRPRAARGARCAARSSKRSAPFERDEIDARRGPRLLRGEGEPYKVELVDDLPRASISVLPPGRLHRPLPRPPRPDARRRSRRFKLLSVAGAYWRGDRARPDAARASTAPRSSTRRDLDEHLAAARGGRERATTASSAAQLDLFHFRELAPGTPFWHPKGMVVWQRARGLCARAENARAATTRSARRIIYDADLWKTLGPLGQLPRRHVPRSRVEGRTFGAQADELPRPLPHLRRRRRAATATCPLRARRGREPAPQRALGRRCTASCACAHFTQDDAHIFCTPRADRRTRSLGCLDFVDCLYDAVRTRDARRALDPARERASGTDEEWDCAEAGAAQTALATRAAATTTSTRATAPSTARRSTSHMTDSLGRSWQLGDDPARLPDAAALRARLHRRATTPSTRRS